MICFKVCIRFSLSYRFIRCVVFASGGFAEGFTCVHGIQKIFSKDLKFFIL